MRNALSRFEQVDFETKSAKDGARKKLLVAAKRYGIVPIGFITGQIPLATGRRAPAADRHSHSPADRYRGLDGAPAATWRCLRQVLDDHRDIIRAAVAAGGGHEVDARADEFFAVFEHPIGALEAAIGNSSRRWPLTRGRSRQCFESAPAFTPANRYFGDTTMSAFRCTLPRESRRPRTAARSCFRQHPSKPWPTTGPRASTRAASAPSLFPEFRTLRSCTR